MRKYYAYKPTGRGREPVGISDRLLFELKTDAGAIRKAIRIFGNTARVYQYTNFFDVKTFRSVK